MQQKLLGIAPFTQALYPRACQQAYAHSRRRRVDWGVLDQRAGAGVRL